jgi:hypothetical protein
VNRIGLVLALVLGLAALLVVSKRKQADLARGLPPRVVCVSQADALAQAGAGATPILGTGSMAPWIPAALPGLDPRKTVVAYAVIDTAATHDGITTGALVVYFATWAGGRVIHQAAARDSGGWIMSGLHNERSETWERVTAANYVGTVARVYVWAQ